MKVNFTVLTLFILFHIPYLFSQNWDWVQKGNLSGDEGTGSGVASDASGNVYITGQFRNTLTIGDISLVSEDFSDDIFIAKFNSNGICQWAQKAGGVLDGDLGSDISVDASGNCYVTGSFRGTASFGNIIVTSNSDNMNMFIAKFDNNGICQWVQNAVNSWSDGSGIAVDASGNCYVTGIYWETVTFGNITLTCGEGMTNGFIAKYDNNGSCLWVQKAGGTIEGIGSEGFDIEIDLLGNCYITGYFSGTTTFGNFTVISKDNGFYGDIFIAKYNSSGVCLWVQKAGGNSDDYGYRICCDQSGNCYVTGIFSRIATFGNLTLLSSGYEDIFIAKYNSNGICQWVQKAGGSWFDYSGGISVDSKGNCYVTGEFASTATIGDTTLTGNTNVFISKFNNDGIFQWVQKIGGYTVRAGRIVTDSFDNYYIIGSFSPGTEKFGNIILNNTSNGIFVAKGYGNSVSGKVLYNGDATRPVQGVTVSLTNGLETLTGTTDVAGNYSIPNALAGTYSLSATTVTPWLGEAAADLSDAIRMVQSYVYPTIWPISNPSLQFNASDVNNDNSIFSSDALQLMARLRGAITSFNRGDWTFGTLPDVVVTSASLTDQNIQALAVGDARMDYSPTAALAKSNVTLMNSDVLNVNTKQEFEVPVKVSSDIQIGGLLLRFAYPSELVTFQGITSSLEGIAVTQKDGIVSLSWLDFSAGKAVKNLKTNDVLFKIIFKPTENFSKNSSFSLEMTKLNQIADIEGNLTKGASLISARVEALVPDKFAVRQNYPNPFNPSTTITYSLPVISNVKLVVSNSLGQKVKELVNEVKEEGNYEVKLDGRNLPSGIYFYSINAKSIDGTKSFWDVKKAILLK